MRHLERVPFAPPPAYWGVFFVIVGGLLGGILGPLLADAGERLPHPLYYAWMGFVLGLVVLLGLSFPNLEVEADATGLRARFGPFVRRVPREAILEARPEPYRWWRYGGWGWRFGFAGEALSTLTTSRGIFLRWRNRKGRTRRLFVSCRDPDGALRALGLAPV